MSALQEKTVSQPAVMFMAMELRRKIRDYTASKTEVTRSARR